jgi:hypothetical protein
MRSYSVISCKWAVGYTTLFDKGHEFSYDLT